MKGVLLNSNRLAIPEAYDELKTRTFEKIFAEWDMDKPLYERDYAKLLSILSGKSYKVEDVENEEKIWQLVRWVVESQPNFKKEPPSEIKIGEKVLSVPQNIGKLSIGQNIVMHQLLENKAHVEECIGMALAIYLQPLYDGGRFNYESAQRLYEEHIGNMPITQTYTLGFFFLIRVLKNGNQPQPIWRRVLNNQIINSKVMWQSWRRSKTLQGFQISH